MLGTVSLLAAALVTPAAQASCSTDSTVMWSQPSGPEQLFDPDTVFRALVGEGQSPRDAYAVRLLLDGQPVAASVDVTEHPGNSPYETRYLHTLVPAEPMVEGARYTFEIIHESGDEGQGRTVTSLVEPAEDTVVVGAPTVTIQTAFDAEGEGETSCDYAEMRTFDLTLTPAVPDETERSVLHLYRLKSEADTWHYVRAFRVPDDGEPLVLDVSFDRNLDWGSCFVAIQEDIHGNESAVSDLACAGTPLAATDEDSLGPGADAEPVDSSPRGCSSTSAVAGWATMWLACLIGVARRER